MKGFAIRSISVGLLWASTCMASRTLSYKTTVLDVIDGNTIVISNKVFQHGIELKAEDNVVLDGVASPKLEQTGGKEAKHFLEGLVKGKVVTIIELTDQGRSYGAWVFVGPDEECVNLRLVEEGHAWVVEPRAQFAVSMGKPKKAYARLDKARNQAEEQKKGIWASEDPVPPWEWIKNESREKETKPQK